MLLEIKNNKTINAKEIEKNLPETLLNEFENKQYGKDYLVDLDNKLKNYFFK